ncbi:hypothetical protein GA0074695_4509 [Micromonospora viridifaciens]|uniref:Uncharacterized protein n=1 Tax=Micromonospora viridifaciens TaxID=1881 RepID=A0A1C4YP04_MICVI|nr:hypothetical protein [Micromonospora viridifaciens]SCF22424.1 hypothetical protein GA0074695_4509 [Micromonospora viridifaciens]
MRRMFSLGSALVAGALVATVSATPAVAAGDEGVHGWVPAPQPPFSQPAGARCDFPIRVEAVVDEVRKLVLATFPDGKPRREIYQGALLSRVTNTATGASTLVDAGGSAMVEYAEDRSMTWYVTGPVLFGFGENAGTLPRGLWNIDGQFVVEFSPTSYKTLTMLHGTTHDVCTDLD